MIFLFENFAESRLVDGIGAADTTLRLPPSDAAKWPQPNGGSERASVVLYDGVQSPEIVYVVTNPGTGVVTIERGMEGSGARAWQAGTAAINTPTKVSLNYLASGGSDSWHQELVDAVNEAYARITITNQLILDGDSALATRIELVETAFGESSAAVQTLMQAFSDIDSAWASYQVSVTAQTADAVAKATQSLNTSVSNGTAVATLRTDLETAVGNNFAGFAEKIQAFVDFDEAQVTVNTDYAVRIGDAEQGLAETSASLSEEILLRATQYEAQVEVNTDIETRVGNNTAGLSEEITVRSTETSALATRATSLEAEVTAGRGGAASLSARINTVESVAASQTTAMASRATTLEAQMANTAGSGLQSRISTEESVRASADDTLASRATTLESTVNNGTTGVVAAHARITTEESTRASADTALASRATSLESKTVRNVNLLANGSGRDGLRGWNNPWFLVGEWTFGTFFYNDLTTPLATQAYTDLIRAPAGYTFTLSGKGYAYNLASGFVSIQIYTYNAGGSGETYLGQMVLPPSGRDPTPFTFTIPGGKEYIRVWPTVNCTPSGTANIAFWNLKLEEGAVATLYSDEAGLKQTTARITTEETTRATADTALATRATTLESQMAGGTASFINSRIATEETTRASADSTLAGRATTLESQMAGSTASFINSRIATEETTRASADSTLAGRATTLESQMAGGTASFINSRIATEESTRATADAAQATRSTTIEASVTLAASAAMPSTFDNGGTTFVWNYGGTPAGRQPISQLLGSGATVHNFTIEPIATIGKVLQYNSLGATTDVMTIGDLTMVAGRRYRMTVRGRCTTPTDGSQELSALGIVYNATGGALNGVGDGLTARVTLAQNVWATATIEFSADDYLGYASFFQMGTRSRGIGTFQLSVIEVLDITDIVAANARITTEEGVRATADTALAARSTTLEAQIKINPNLFPQSSARNLTGWGNMNWYRYDTAYGPTFRRDVPAGTTVASQSYSQPFSVAASSVHTISARGFTDGPIPAGALPTLNIYAYDSADPNSFAGETYVGALAIPPSSGRYPTYDLTPLVVTIPAGKYGVRVWPTVSLTAGDSTVVNLFWNVKVEFGSTATPYSEEAAGNLLNARLTTTETTVVDHANNFNLAKWEVEAAASGSLPTRLRLQSGTYGSAIAMEASEIFFGDNTVYDNATDTLQTIVGSRAYIDAWGASFGAAGDLRHWTGPTGIALSSMSKANAEFYISTTPKFIGGPMFSPQRSVTNAFSTVGKNQSSPTTAASPPAMSAMGSGTFTFRVSGQVQSLENGTSAQVVGTYAVKMTQGGTTTTVLTGDCGAATNVAQVITPKSVQVANSYTGTTTFTMETTGEGATTRSNGDLAGFLEIEYQP